MLQDVEHMKTYFNGFAPVIQKALSYVDEAYVWRMMETMPASWVSTSGKVVLVGDAAHAVLPFAGQVHKPPSSQVVNENSLLTMGLTIGRMYGDRGCLGSSRMLRARP
jgi:hypothetical protein